MTLNHSNKEQQIHNGQARNPHVQTLLLLSVFLAQFFELALGLFGRVTQFVDVAVRAQNLLTLRRHLMQHVRCGFVGLVIGLGGVFQSLCLIRGVKDRRLITRCGGATALLV